MVEGWDCLVSPKISCGNFHEDCIHSNPTGLFGVPDFYSDQPLTIFDQEIPVVDSRLRSPGVDVVEVGNHVRQLPCLPQVHWKRMACNICECSGQMPVFDACPQEPAGRQRRRRFWAQRILLAAALRCGWWLPSTKATGRRGIMPSWRVGRSCAGRLVFTFEQWDFHLYRKIFLEYGHRF